MVFEAHDVFEAPPVGTPLWRYADLLKILHLLETKRLHFTRGDTFDDPFEGSIPKPNREEIIQMQQIAKSSDSKVARDFIAGVTQYGQMAQFVRGHVAVQCWHANEHESEAMWRRYSRVGEGIAVKSTFERLGSAIKCDPDIHVFAGLVKYIDYSKDKIPPHNMLLPIMHKRISYKHEQEVRVVLFSERFMKNDETLSEAGIDIDLDVETLVEAIYVAPTTPDWVYELVKKVVARYGAAIEVRRSSLDDQPLW